MKLLLIDNYDSFTYNLVQYLGELGVDPKRDMRIIRNDQWTLEQVHNYAPDAVMISPGPCTPDEAGICIELVRHYWGKLPLFGVCLGLQVMVQAMGGRIVRAKQVMHGKLSAIRHDGRGVFTDLPSPLTMIRYHSLIAEPASLPDCFEVSARVEGGEEIMAIRGLIQPMVEAVQFHPESILSQHGHDMLKRFIERALKVHA